MIRPLPLTSGTNLDVSQTTAGDTATVAMYNCYVDRGDAVKAIPGCEEYLDLGVSGAVWSWYCLAHSTLFIVADGRIWQQTEKNGIPTEIAGATLVVGAPPTFAADKDAVFVAANSKIYRIAGGVATSLGAGSPDNVTSIIYAGGYLLANGDAAGGAVAGDTHYSDDVDNDYALWEVYNNETRPDGLMALVSAYEQIYNIGRSSLEVTYIDGTVPFSVNKNAAQHFGTPATYSVAFDKENLYYVSEAGESRVVIILKGGGAPEIISFPLSLPIDSFERVDDAQGFIMSFAGQNGYAITFPNANTVVDEQHFGEITLFYHLQRKQWIILGQWDTTQGKYRAYRGASSCYVEPWGLRLVGGRDGKLYQLMKDRDVSYGDERVFEHSWRNDHEREWRIPRSIDMGALGEYEGQPSKRQNGRFRKRQHRFVYTDQSDAGTTFRAEVKTGQVSYGIPTNKVSNVYRYDIEKGTGEFVLNGVTEEFDVLRS